MKNEWGFGELVVHSPPINFLTIFLIPCVLRRTFMKRGGEAFSKLIFWIENTIYIIITFIYEIFFVPLIFLKVIFDIIRYATFLEMIFLLFSWLIFGMVFLIFGVFKDMFFFIKILCDYKDEDDDNEEKEMEDQR
jgi:hypothetical protein